MGTTLVLGIDRSRRTGLRSLLADASFFQPECSVGCGDTLGGFGGGDDGCMADRGDNNIFTQIGLMVLVGLSAKNAILIVEFSRTLEFDGRSPLQAAIEASRLRLRPILMTSMAFIMGVLPLVYSSGAGAEVRRVMGVTVFSGMLGVTFFGLFLTPVFYVLMRALTGNRPLRNDTHV